MWNAERPRYLDIFFQTGFTPPCAGPRQRDLRHSYGGQVLHNTGGQVRFTTTPFMTGFLSEPEDLRAGGRFAPTRRFTWIVGMFFLFF
jgi:hypothetical protein